MVIDKFLPSSVVHGLLVDIVCEDLVIRTGYDATTTWLISDILVNANVAKVVIHETPNIDEEIQKLYPHITFTGLPESQFSEKSWEELFSNATILTESDLGLGNLFKIKNINLRW